MASGTDYLTFRSL
uniref:Uncharacterized protein n=1 Tax=Arundo donax TaxID=35708 RepID=A0A0A9EM62_ARUDO